MLSVDGVEIHRHENQTPSRKIKVIVAWRIGR
jgi:hypothetical protein